MSGRKKPARSAHRRLQHVDAALTAAITNGQAAAKAALRARARSARARKTIIRSLGGRNALAASQPTLAIPDHTRKLLGESRSSGTLIAEGDSWFDYPMQDILSTLEDDYLYDIESVARKGERLEDMAYAGGQFQAFARRLEKLLRAKTVPKAILLSGGGNDIAGEEFSLLLNHATSPLPTLNEDIVRGVIDVRLRDAYAHIISGLTAIVKGYLDAPLPIVVHGYAHPVPDGRGFLGGWAVLPGPWLRPGFLKKGHTNQAQNTAVMATLIDRFNSMLATLASVPEFSHLHYVDLRSELANDASYRSSWANELHPTRAGFDLVSARIAATLIAL